MNKTPDPLEVVRDKVVPAAEELVASVAERVSPLAKEAVDSVSPVAQAAAERTVALVHAAAEKVGPLTQQTRDAVAPYAQHAAVVVTPYAVRVGPLAHSAADRVGPLAQQAAVAVAPYAALVKEQSLKTGHDLADRLEPAYEAALGALSGARGKVGDVIPVVGAAATSAAASASPFVTAAADRGKALVRSVRSDTSEPAVVAPPQPSKKKRGWLTTFAVVAAAAGATYVVVRRLVGDKGSQWQAARPSTPYAPPTSAGSAAGVSTVAEAGSDQETGSAQAVYGGTGQPEHAGEGGVAEASTISYYGMGMAPTDDTAGASLGTDEDATAVAENVRTTDLVADSDEGETPVPVQTEQHRSSEGASRSAFSTPEGASGPDDEPTSPYGEERVEMELETAEERVHEEPDDAVLAEQDQEAGVGPDAHPERYLDIPGVYVGVEPPEGYTIKGNERSMKYHLPDSNSYGRTIAEIWFMDEAAAQQAGFTRAQH